MTKPKIKVVQTDPSGKIEVPNKEGEATFDNFLPLPPNSIRERLIEW